MATIIFAAAGAALGGAVGGSVLGLSSAVLGRAIGSTVGRLIDQQLLGGGSEVVEGPRLSRYRITGASEGAPIGRVYGRMRVGGQVIWTTQFRERVTKKSQGGKGGGREVTTKTYRYSVSLAVALGEGEISGVGRIWADGIEISPDRLNMRVYSGAMDQEPDPLIEAIEGVGNAPAYRGTAYVVLEDMALAEFGNRVPQLSFEIVRPTDPALVPEEARSLNAQVRGVAVMPGSGEYVLATTPVKRSSGLGRTRYVNMNTPSGVTDFEHSLTQLRRELPNCEAASLIVSWFGNDLRCGSCTIEPKVEPGSTGGVSMPWRVSGIDRASAARVPALDGRAIYGGTPTDASVIEAIQAMRAAGQHVTFYPFILMEQLQGNSLPDPWSGQNGQPHLPWRGRITTSIAPDQPGSTDGTPAAAMEVSNFFGTAGAGDFAEGVQTVTYAGPPEFSYRRFILHYAQLCKMAGGVDAFCIGSEMRALTQIRGANNSFPAVSELVRLAQDVRSILGQDTKIGYAADWSEYFGYQPQNGSGDVFFHLDPLWSDPAIDFIGIDNYMPLSDWRDGEAHLDAQAGWSAIHEIDYLRGNVAGGEGYDFYYADQEARDAQTRTPILDSAHGEHWVFRYKDLQGWWENPHHERIGGVRQSSPTAWVPGSKPFWFTEFGCAALDKATNQPNKFLDPKSSESQLPYYSDGGRDELIQAQYLRAVMSYWEAAENNPVSPVYGASMVDMSKAHVWAWDARPYPAFPARADLWSDGANYDRGHWINGRTSNEALSAIVADMCRRAGLEPGEFDVSQVRGLVRGVEFDMAQGARSSLQPLMLAYGMEASERDGILRFSMRTGRSHHVIDANALATSDELEGDAEFLRGPEGESPNRVQLTSVRAGGDYGTMASEIALPGAAPGQTMQSELPLVLSPAEADSIARRWLAESRIARETARFSLPPSLLELGAGDVVRLETDGQEDVYRIDRVELGEGQLVDAVRVEAGVYRPQPISEPETPYLAYEAGTPADPIFMDLPLITGDEVPHAPHVAIAAEPWPGEVAIYSSTSDAGYAVNRVVEDPSTVGVTLDPLPRACPGVWDNGPGLRITLSTGGPLASADRSALLAGANAVAIGTGGPMGWEILQFRDAELVGEDTYLVRRLLRGQLGTDAEIPEVWPEGSVVVLLDGAPVQIDVPAAARGLQRHYRVGATDLSLDDPSVRHEVLSFEGIGLRPYSPAHLRIVEQADGGLLARWQRRTRIDGDSWEGVDVPLGEDSERYRVRVRDGSDALIRTTETSVPTWTYPASMRAEDSHEARVIEVAQVSTRFGAGPYKRIEFNG